MTPNPPQDALAAIIDGTLGTSQSTIKATCLSGNCTWPTTPTSGICSACNNVKDQATSQLKDALNGDDPDHLFQYANFELPTTIIDIDPNDGNGTHTFSTVSTLSVQTPMFEPLFSVQTIIPNGTMGVFVDGRQELATIWALGVPASLFGNATSLNESAPNITANADPLIVAYSCSLYFCLQA